MHYFKVFSPDFVLWYLPFSQEEEDEIEASVRQVNAILGELPQSAAGPVSAEELASSAAWTRLQPLLTVETK